MKLKVKIIRATSEHVLPAKKNMLQYTLDTLAIGMYE